ncbi:hypothetical protein IE53DRAFT_383031 [Violaceomyces palustris]|uniref:Uncharacterized protein n=1 Tax=Violaceomyces palustris TaxID=1673888 RepID=A0ACD0P8R2_9BASI|nr:hypothetical protein IE53DRAFT_383031 [Violaceomyces palustris]
MIPAPGLAFANLLDPSHGVKALLHGQEGLSGFQQRQEYPPQHDRQKNLPRQVKVRSLLGRDSSNEAEQVPLPSCLSNGRIFTLDADASCTNLALLFAVGDYQVQVTNPWLSKNGTVDPYSAECLIPAGTLICMEQPCVNYIIQPGDTCDSIVENNPLARVVSPSQLGDFNPELGNDCEDISSHLGDRICITPNADMRSLLPQSTYDSAEFPSITLVTTTPDPDSGGIRISPTPTTSETPSPTSTPQATYINTGLPSPTNLAQGSLSHACGYYIDVQASDNCASIENDWFVAESDLEAWNREINCTKNPDLSSLAGKAICVTGPWGAIPPAPVPSNAAQPVDQNCIEFVTSKTGDTCTSFATAYGLTLDQFRALNMVLNAQCSNFNAQTAYCIAEDGTNGAGGSSSPSSNSSPTGRSSSSISRSSSGTTTATNVVNGASQRFPLSLIPLSLAPLALALPLVNACYEYFYQV